MLDYLIDLDSEALLAINGWHDIFQDAFWFMLSSKLASVLIALGLIWVLLHKKRSYALLVIAMLALTITIADQVSSGIIKSLVERFRPTHDPTIGALVHTVNGYRGGMYGFVSSHAANAFGAITLISLIMRQRLVLFPLLLWALLQCYSRIYLGVHYPGDILGGIVVGLASGWLVWLLMRLIQRRFNISNATFTESEGAVIASSVGITIIGIAVAAAFQAW